MRVGNEKAFAVDWEITQVVEGWILGRFCLYIGGSGVGDFEDPSVDLKGCLRWIRDFLERPVNRYEPGLYEMDKGQVYLRLGSAVLANENPNNFVPSFYDQTFERFHISHIGMSSFDRTTLLVMKNAEGNERCVWHTSNSEVKEAYLDAGEIERVLSEVVIHMAEQIAHAEKLAY